MLVFKECCTLWRCTSSKQTCIFAFLQNGLVSWKACYFLEGNVEPVWRMPCNYMLHKHFTYIISFKKWCDLWLEYVLILFESNSVYLLCLWRKQQTLPLWDEQRLLEEMWLSLRECYPLKWNEFSRNAASFEWKCILKILILSIGITSSK
jgi:hypothetical protein